jgi:hypothetical protein
MRIVKVFSNEERVRSQKNAPMIYPTNINRIDIKTLFKKKQQPPQNRPKMRAGMNPQGVVQRKIHIIAH